MADLIPPEINWILRVDGHTDKTPVTLTSPFRDNWELSEARALSVVRYMIAVSGPPAGPAGGYRASASTSRSTPATRPRRWRRTGGSS